MSTLKLEASLLPPGCSVLCALSGGADSVCLLSLLREQPGLRLSAAHYNHCLRGEESDADEDFVRGLCEDWGVSLYTGRGDVAAYAKERGLSIETAARELRYAFLRTTAEKIGADCIATAHNANDNVETLLLRMARGTALRGLCGIPRERDGLIRPLLGVSRQEIEDYLSQRGIPHREDSSNALDEAARNRLRHYALPALQSVNPAYTTAVGRLTEDLRQDEDFLSVQAAAAYAKIADGEGLSVSGLLSLHPALQARVLRQLCGGNLQQQHRTDILRLCESGGSGALTLPGLTLYKSYDRLSVKTEAKETPLPDVALSPGESFLWGSTRVKCELCSENAEIQDSFNTFSFSCGKICGTLFLTRRREGDTILFAHRAGTRKLHRLFIDAKIPVAERDRIPVLRDEQGVLAVGGFGAAARAQAQAGEAHIRISFEKYCGGTEK